MKHTITKTSKYLVTLFEEIIRIRHWRSVKRSHIIAIAIVGGILAFIGGSIFGGAVATQNTEIKSREVTLASVSELASESTPLPLVGAVVSVSEATIRAESSGQITGVYRKLGDYVGAGSIIAEIENSRERASLASAEAGLKSAQANASISGISGRSQAELLEEAKTATVNTLRSAYDAVDSAIRSNIDPMFVDANLSSPKFRPLVSNNQLVIDVNFGRLQMSDILKEEASRKTTLGATSDLKKEISLTEIELKQTQNFTDDVISALNQSVPTSEIPQSTIDGWKAVALSARGSISGSLASLSNARDNLTAKQAQYDISLKQSGGGELSTSDALVAQAEAGLRVAKVNLEKTIIRSPINGTLNSFSLERGDFVTAFQEVAVVSNNNALEIRAYITEDDARAVAPGNTAVIDGKIQGIVTRVAPALDPLTKKIEVRIGISGDASRLINGSSVRVDISRVARKIEQGEPVSIPISAIKITALGAVVFSIDENNTLVSHTVTLGNLEGGKVEILSGVSPELRIVSDARGLRAGDSVSIR